MATVEFGDFACSEFGGFTDHTSAIPTNPEICSIFPETGSVKSFNSALAQSFNFNQKTVTFPDTNILRKSNEQEGKFKFNSVLEQGFSQNQIGKLSGMHIHRDFITHLSLTDEGLSNMQNLSIPSLTSLSFFAEKTNSFELELSVAKDFPNPSKEESSEIENTNFLLDLSLPMKEEAKFEEPSKGLNLDEDLLSLNFGGLEVMEERIESIPIAPNTSVGDSKGMESSIEAQKMQISKETEDIIKSLPDLSYLMSRVLVFPVEQKLYV